MKKILVIVGPTASGKSSLGLKLAKALGGEIISADSRAIYRGLRIGTDRVPGRWIGKGKNKSFVYQGVPHHLADFLNPKKVWSAHDFAQAARALITKTERPLVVGGTGFWIDALVKPELLAGSPPNPLLRRQLVKKTLKQLLSELKKLDPSRAKTIQKTNKRRLIRAIEVAKFSKEGPANHVILNSIQNPGRLNLDPDFHQDDKKGYNVLYLGRTSPNNELKKRIYMRFTKWLQQGLVAETKNLTRKVSRKRLKEIGLMYPIIADYLDGKISRAQMIERSVNSIYHYAKRQKTWFKKNKDIHWVKNHTQALYLAKQFLNQKEAR